VQAGDLRRNLSSLSLVQLLVPNLDSISLAALILQEANDGNTDDAENDDVA
jgi:hypothetical protein